MENKTAEEIFDIFFKGENKVHTWVKDFVITAMKKYGEQERLLGIEEGFNAARETKMELVYERIKGEIELTGEIELLKYQDLNDYLNSKNKP